MTARLFRAVALVGQPATPTPLGCDVTSTPFSRRAPTSKLLRVAAFGAQQPSAFDYSFRVYVVMDTGDALQARADDDIDDGDAIDAFCLSTSTVLTLRPCGRIEHRWSGW